MKNGNVTQKKTTKQLLEMKMQREKDNDVEDGVKAKTRLEGGECVNEMRSITVSRESEGKLKAKMA